MSAAKLHTIEIIAESFDVALLKAKQEAVAWLVDQDDPSGGFKYPTAQLVFSGCFVALTAWDHERGDPTFTFDVVF